MARDFTGTWKIVSDGPRRDEEFEVTTEDGTEFEVGLTSSTLGFDPSACVLKNEKICISLFHDSEQECFGVEDVGGDYVAWAANRIGPGDHPVTAEGPIPDILYPRFWNVRDKTDGDSEPPEISDDVRITGPNADKYTISARTPGDPNWSPYDSELGLNEINRSLDSSRCIAHWPRATGKRDVIFARRHVSIDEIKKTDNCIRQIEKELSADSTEDLAHLDAAYYKVYEDLKLLPCEGRAVLRLIRQLAASGLEAGQWPAEGSTVVWGAEEGLS